MIKASDLLIAWGVLAAFAVSTLSAAEEGWRWQARASSEYLFPAEGVREGQNREGSHSGVALSGAGAVGSARLGFSSGYVFRDYRWEEGGTPPVGTPAVPEVPYDDLRSILIGMDYSQPMAPPWGLFARGTYEWSVASTDGIPTPSYGDAGRGSVAAGLTYQLSPAFRLSFGGLWIERLERDNLLLPMLFLDWRIDDHWSLRTSNGVQVFYDVSADRRHLLSAEVAWDSLNFSYNGPVFGDVTATGAGRERAVRASFAWQWNVNPHFAVRPELSYRFAQQVEFRKDGQRVAESDLEGAFAIGASVSARF